MVVGTSQTFTQGGITITAYGYDNAGSIQNTPPLSGNINLVEKNTGSTEMGLGLNNDPTGDHEISGTSVILIDFSNAVNAGVQNGTFDFSMNSVINSTPPNDACLEDPIPRETPYHVARPSGSLLHRS
jgi:hypothetical protein